MRIRIPNTDWYKPLARCICPAARWAPASSPRWPTRTGRSAWGDPCRPATRYQGSGLWQWFPCTLKCTHVNCIWKPACRIFLNSINILFWIMNLRYVAGVALFGWSRKKHGGSGSSSRSKQVFKISKQICKKSVHLYTRLQIKVNKTVPLKK